MSTPFQLGFKQLPDPRDALYPLGAIMKETATIPISKVWSPGPVTDQGDESSCVGHSTFKLLTSEPVLQDPGIISPSFIYDEARENDEWPTGKETDSGTSVRAGLEVLRRHGLIEAYYWADGAEQILEYLLKFGPLIFGTNWYSDMFHPDSNGMLRVSGSLAGGHSYLVYAGSWQDRTVTLRNSWSESWGKSGDAIMSLADVDNLMRMGGVAAAVIEP